MNEDENYIYQERAAILEFDARFKREEAELRAAEEMMSEEDFIEWMEAEFGIDECPML